MSPAQLLLRTILLCDYALTGQDGKISAVGIFGQINVSRLPAVHPRLFIVAIMDAEPGPHDLTLQVLSPKGGRLLETSPTSLPTSTASSCEIWAVTRSSCGRAADCWAAPRSMST